MNLLTNPTIRTAFLAQLALHEAQDRIVQGLYGDVCQSIDTFRGCYFGCNWNSLRAVLPPGTLTCSPKNRDEIANAMGLPRLVAYVAEDIFENLPRSDAVTFPYAMGAAMVSAVERGADLSLVWPRFALALLVDPKQGMLCFARSQYARSAIQSAATLYQRTIDGEVVSREEWRTAALDTAHIGHHVAARTAFSLASVMWNDNTIDVVDAVRSAARVQTWHWQRNLLLELMHEAV